MYIYSIFIKKCHFDDLSYGYPMVMLWLSYGAHSHFFLIWLSSVRNERLRTRIKLREKDEDIAKH